MCPRFSKKAYILVLLQKKRFSPQFFVEYFYKNIRDLKIKIIHLNRGHTFVLYYLIFAWVKFHSNIMRFTWVGAEQSYRKVSKKIFSFANLSAHAAISSCVNRYHNYEHMV